MKRWFQRLIALALFTLLPNQAFAVCANPAGAEGELVYNSTHKVLQFCNGTLWIATGGQITEVDPEVGTLTATKWCTANAGGTAIDCTQDEPTGGGLPVGCQMGDSPVWNGSAWVCPAAMPFLVSYVTSSESTANTITIPASAQAGDLAVLLDWGRTGNNSNPPDASPAGFTKAFTFTADNGGSSARTTASYKILTALDIGATVTGIDAQVDQKLMLVYRATKSINSIASSTWTSQITKNDPNAQTVTASGQTVPLIVYGAVGSSDGLAAFSTASPAFDGTVTLTGGNLRAGYKIYNNSPANHSIDGPAMSSSDAGVALFSGYLRLIE